MANEFYRVFVTVTLQNEKLVYWRMNSSSFRPSGPVSFYVDRARSGGEWENIAGPIVDDCYFMDTEKLNWNKDKNTFYRVRYQAGTDWVYSVPAQAIGEWSNDDYCIARDICRREVVQQARVGMPGVLLKRRTWGTPCPDCLDFDTRQPTDMHCATCFGVGITGGYYAPIPIAVIPVAPEQSDREMSDQGVVQPTVKAVRCIAYPFIEDNDLWFNSHNGQRWTIRRVEIMSELKGIPILYRLLIREIPQTDVMYTADANDLAEEVPTEQPTGTEHTWHSKLNCESEF